MTKFLTCSRKLAYLLGLIALLIWPYQGAAAQSLPALPVRPAPAGQGCAEGQATLLSPENGKELTSLLTSFAFRPFSAYDRYYLQVETDPTFGTFDAELSERGSTFTISDPAVPSYEYKASLAQNFLPNTTYYWRVTPVCGGVKGTPSSVFTFTTPASAARLPAPQPTKPDNLAKTYSTGVTFTWNPVPGATSYVLRFYGYKSDADTDTEFLQKADGVIYHIGSPMHQILGMPNDVTLYWRVAAVDGYAVGALSEVFQFTTPVKTNAKTIDETGGKLVTTAGVDIEVQPGTVSSATDFQFNLNSQPSTGAVPFKFGNRAFTLTATNLATGEPITEFSPPLLVTIHFTDEDVKYGDLEVWALTLYYLTGSSWRRIPVAFPFYDEHYVQYQLSHFTEFAFGAAEYLYIPLTVR